MAIVVPTETIERAQKGGPVEIESLVAAIWPDAYRLAYAVLGERHAAEDAAQEACIAMYRTIGSLRASAAFGVWFYRIVVREASAARRKQRRRDPPADDRPAIIDGADTIDVWRALATLSPALRDVVVLRYFEDLSSREIGYVLRVPSGTVRFRLAVAMRKLRPLLEDRSTSDTPVSGEVRIHAL